jgi:hypothetical protein
MNRWVAFCVNNESRCYVIMTKAINLSSCWNRTSERRPEAVCIFQNFRKLSRSRWVWAKDPVFHEVSVSPIHLRMCQLWLMLHEVSVPPIHLRICQLWLMLHEVPVPPIHLRICQLWLMLHEVSVSPIHLRICQLWLMLHEVSMSPIHLRICQLW